MNQPQNVAVATMAELQQVIGGIMGLHTCIPSASDHLGLDMAQVGIFCRNTPGGKKGEQLWQEFKGRMKASSNENYDFTSFMTEVLAEAGHPLPASTYKCVVCETIWTETQLLGDATHKTCGDPCCGANVREV